VCTGKLLTDRKRRASWQLLENSIQNGATKTKKEEIFAQREKRKKANAKQLSFNVCVCVYVRVSEAEGNNKEKIKPNYKATIPTTTTRTVATTSVINSDKNNNYLQPLTSSWGICKRIYTHLPE